MWEHNENSGGSRTPEFKGGNQDKLKVTMTVCDYSPLKGYLVVGGVEGMMFFYDMQTKLKISQQHRHLHEILGLYFFDPQH